MDHRHPVDFIEPIESSTSREAEALLHVLLWVNKVDTPSHIAARVKTLLVSLGADDSTWVKIAEDCEITREAVRLMSKELEQQFGLRSCNARTDQARASCKRARKSVLAKS